MAVKPPQIRYVTAGKSLGAKIHRGWAATWNWVLSWVHHFKAGMGLKLSGSASGHPKLDVLIEGADGVDVRCAGDGNAYVIGLESGAGGGSGGSGGGGNVDDVEGETYQGGKSIKVTYADGSTPRHIPLAFVKNLSRTTYQNAPAIKVEFSDGSPDVYISYPDSEVTISGVSGNSTTTTSKSNSFTFQSGVQSNVTFAASGTTITVNVFYK